MRPSLYDVPFAEFRGLVPYREVALAVRAGAIPTLDGNRAVFLLVRPPSGRRQQIASGSVCALRQAARSLTNCSKRPRTECVIRDTTSSYFVAKAHPATQYTGCPAYCVSEIKSE
jgi:hypothetical protein